MQEIHARHLDELLWVSQAPYIDGVDRVTWHHRIKRIVDLIIVLLSSILLIPLLVLIAIIIKLDSPGPVLFIQKRVGVKRITLNGRVRWVIKLFPFYKFRTMWNDVNPELHRQYMHAYIAGDEVKMSSLQPELKSSNSYKLSKDPRVTRFGRFLRQTSLDELPQLWNVIRGDMSLVGPRPPIPYEVQKYQREHFRRLGAIPGITGLWQVNGRSETTFEEMVQLDLEYIKQQSTWLDLKILLMTLPVVISQKGAG